ncbi:MAG TPA: cupredoxin domain-containing protein [Acidimicrobiales bacterium]|nr:cupredoxin domain-containing protein [Acidimicrobiales bacterium]
MSKRRHLFCLAVLATASVALASCSDSSGGKAVTVTGSDDGCEIEQTTLPAGKLDFVFTNTADDVNELYVLKADGDVVSEVENVTTGTSRTLSVDLSAGDYQIRCKPGQTGDGFTTPFEVTGTGGATAARAGRTITFEATDFAYTDLDLSGITQGETIRFEMTNRGDQAHEFEVLGPNGTALGEIAAMNPGDTGGATITFERAGSYTFQCILVDPKTEKPHTMLGMTGTFEVDEAG